MIVLRFLFSSVFLLSICSCAGSPARISIMSLSELKKQDTATLCYTYARTRQQKIKDEILSRKEIKDGEWEAIDKKRAFIGMSELALVCSIGSNCDVNESVGKWGTHKQYVFRNCDTCKAMYVYVQNGTVTSFQQ